MEDYQATERNGHQLTDNYDPETNTLDIRSNALYPSNVLKGGNARKRSVTSWQTDQFVWWKGVAIDRQSEGYQKLIRRAYRAMAGFGGLS